ncbi:MAG: glycosyltransferase family 61 protein [Methylacidiphilales bacterium]|nr:glycosyltransferase family 61 protein [Candidatus Methylacidiphilales bacterium]
MNEIYRHLKSLYRWARLRPAELLRVIGRKSLRLGGPVGFYGLLENPHELTLVLAGQESRPVKPDCLRIKCGHRQHSRQPWPIFWKKISPARLVGKSLAVLNNQKKLMLESVYGQEYGPEDPSYNYLSLPPATHLGGSWTSMISRWCQADSQNYYHWMMDALPRLALLDSFPSDTGILTVDRLNSFQRETLEILNIVDRCRPTPEAHLVLENYYHSSFTTMTGCDNPYAIQFLRNKFLAAASAITPAPEKIYITRLGSLRGVHEEEKMIAILEKEGWTIIQAQNYSFRNQIALFSNARAICAIHGAGLTNLLWCQKGCKVLEICPANRLNGCYEGIAAYLDLDYRYMIFEADAKYRPKIDLKAFTSAIKALDHDPVVR